MQNHYDILGIPFSASQEEIKAKYKQLAILFHPDKHGGSRYYEEQFKKISAAYHVLSNPARRRRYDLKIAYASRPAAARKASPSSTSAPKPNTTYRPPAAPKMDKKTERKVYFFTFSGLALFLSLVVTGYIIGNSYLAEKTFKEGVQLETEQKEIQALEKYLMTLEYDQEYGPAYERLGDFKAKQNEDAVALQFYKQALKYEDDPSADLLIKISKLEFMNQNYLKALELAEKAVKKDSANSAALYERSLARFFTGDYKGSSEDLDKLITSEEPSWHYHFLRGKARLNLKDTSGACSDWNKANLFGMNSAEKYLKTYCEISSQ